MHLLGGSTSGHAKDLSATAGGLGVLATDTDAPVVADTSVGADLLQSLDIFTHLADKAVDHDLGGLAGDAILLSIDEPAGHLELAGVGDDGDKSLNLFVSEGAGAAVHVNLSLLADEVGETLAHTRDLAHGEHHLAATVDVGVQHTENVLKLRSHLQAL